MATVSELLAEAVASPEVQLPAPAPTVAPVSIVPVGGTPPPTFGPDLPAGPQDPNAIGVQEQYNLAAARQRGLSQALDTEAQRELAYEPSDVLMRRHGEFEGRLMSVQREAAERAVNVDAARQRTWGELTGDSISNAAQAFAGGIGSLAALGVSTVHDGAGHFCRCGFHGGEFFGGADTGGTAAAGIGNGAPG